MIFGTSAVMKVYSTVFEAQLLKEIEEKNYWVT